ALDSLQAQCVLAGCITISGAQVGCGLCAQIALFSLQLPDLGNQSFTQAGVGRQPLVVLSDLFAQIFLLDFEQRFGILAFESRDEEAEESAYEVREPSEHWDARPLFCNPLQLILTVALTRPGKLSRRRLEIPACVVRFVPDLPAEFELM